MRSRVVDEKKNFQLKINQVFDVLQSLDLKRKQKSESLKEKKSPLKFARVQPQQLFYVRVIEMRAQGAIQQYTPRGVG